MPFDPKLIRAQEPPLAADGELELPCELQALASQLRDDASHLAACYPAQRREVLAPATRPARRPQSITAAMSGVALAVLLLGVTAVLWRLPRPHAAAPVVAPNHVTAAPQRPLVIEEVAERPAPAVSLVSLSGPELEALVDLLERDRAAVATVSF